MGLVRPSDIGMRAALVGETMPATQLIGAMSIQRTTMDSARIAGALTGAGLVAALGIGPAYAVVAGVTISILLTLQAGGASTAGRSAEATGVVVRASPWRDLKEGLAYVWHTPFLRAVMFLAFLLNLTAFLSRMACCPMWRRRSMAPTRRDWVTWSQRRPSAPCWVPSR